MIGFSEKNVVPKKFKKDKKGAQHGGSHLWSSSPILKERGGRREEGKKENMDGGRRQKGRHQAEVKGRGKMAIFPGWGNLVLWIQGFCFSYASI